MCRSFPKDNDKSNNSSDQATAKSSNKHSQESRNNSSIENESNSNKSKDDTKESLEKSVNELKEHINGSSSEAKTNSSTDKTYNVGETVTINDVDYTLVSVEKTKTAMDEDALKISLHVKNNSNRKVYVSSFDVYNNQNQKVQSAIISDMHLLDDVAPGKETTIIDGFEETNPGEYELQFQAGFKTVKYKFTL